MVGVSSRASAQLAYGPSPYAQFADSPFSAVDFSGGYFHLEDHEDGSLNTPGVTASTGFVLPPAPLTDSVDEDDGVVDGFGTASSSSYVSNSNAITFFFNALTLGHLPTHVGVVWTDVGFTTTGLGFDDVMFEAFDPGGASLGVIGPVPLGDGLAGGQTDEDRFFGMYYAGGISRMTLTTINSNDWELDHVQYGYVPEPATWLLLGLGARTVWARRRR